MDTTPSARWSSTYSVSPSSERRCSRRPSWRRASGGSSGPGGGPAAVGKRPRIAVLAGDGIGPEVTKESVETLRLAADVGGFALDFTHFPFGAEHYLKTKETFPPSALEELRGHDAILVGAIGDPRLPVGLLERA